MDNAATLRLLNQIRAIAIADAALLVVLVISAISDSAAVHVLGPIHGVGFLALLYLCARGAGEERWGWWFPAIVLVTAGPLGSLIGELKLRRELTAPA